MIDATVTLRVSVPHAEDAAKVRRGAHLLARQLGAATVTSELRVPDVGDAGLTLEADELDL